MEVSISIATSSDAEELAQIKYENIWHRMMLGELPQTSARALAAATTGAAEVELLRNILAEGSQKDYYLALRDPERIYGFCRMTWREEPGAYQFRQFYVHPSHWGRGLGSRLIREAKRRAAESRSSRYLFLHTGDYNAAAQAKYAHWGFELMPSAESTFEPARDGRLVEWRKMTFRF